MSLVVRIPFKYNGRQYLPGEAFPGPRGICATRMRNAIYGRKYVEEVEFAAANRPALGVDLEALKAAEEKEIQEAEAAKAEAARLAEETRKAEERAAKEKAEAEEAISKRKFFDFSKKK